MKSVLLAAVALTAMSLTSQSVFAANTIPSTPEFKPYVSLFGGAALLTHDVTTTYSGFSSGTDIFKPGMGYVIGGVIGVEWNDRIRTELELSHAHWGLGDRFLEIISNSSFPITRPGGFVNATYLLGNVWVNLTDNGPMKTYAGGGLGIAWADMNNTYASLTSAGPSFAFQIGAGITYDINDHLKLDVGYRFKDIIQPNMNPGFSEATILDSFVDSNLASHNFQVGLTYKF